MKPTRHVRIEGDQMLPPGEDPVPPPMSREERVVVFPPVEQLLLKSEWCLFREAGLAPDALRGGRWVNEPEYWGRYYGSGKGLKGCPPPIFRYDRLSAERASRPNYLPDFWTYGGFFIFSPRFMGLLDQEAPGAFDKLPLRIEDREGNFVRDDYFFADVVLIRKAIDWANSVVAYEYMSNDSNEFPMPMPSRIFMRSESTFDVNIVRDAHRLSYVFIRRSLADRIFKIKPKITNLNFPPVW